MDPMDSDPMLDALEQQNEGTVIPGESPTDDWAGLDRVGRMCGELERSIEGTTVPPTSQEEPDFSPPISPSPPSLAVGGPRSPDPPIPEEHRPVEWVEMKSSFASRPYFAHDGLSREPYRPHPGRNTGSLDRTSVPTRWCPDRREAVEVTACEECDKWGNHGGQMEECLYDWEEKQRPKESQEGESEE